MRNLVHIEDKTHVLFLYPKENHNINRKAQFAYENIVSNKGKNRFKIIYLDEIVTFIKKARIRNDKLLSHYKEFEAKYMNY